MNYSLFDQTESIVSKEKEKVFIQALRLLISFTTLSKFCDPLTKLTTVNNMPRVLCEELVVLAGARNIFAALRFCLYFRVCFERSRVEWE